MLIVLLVVLVVRVMLVLLVMPAVLVAPVVLVILLVSDARRVSRLVSAGSQTAFQALASWPHTTRVDLA